MLNCTRAAGRRNAAGGVCYNGAVMEHDTEIGGPTARFPATRHSAVVATCSTDAVTRRRAYETLIAAYWKPVYKYLRLRWNADSERAKDLTQGFFANVLEKGHFERYDPRRAAFRTYVRRCLDGYVANEHKAGRRLKRGGGRSTLSLDYEGAEKELRSQLADREPSPETYFDAEWVRSVLALAVAALESECRTEGKTTHFAVFEAYDLDGAQQATRPTYAALAARFEIPVTQVTNYLSWTRRRFRRLVLEQLRSCTGSDEEFVEQARALTGGEIE